MTTTLFRSRSAADATLGGTHRDDLLDENRRVLAVLTFFGRSASR
jgi:hypothetical protein